MPSDAFKALKRHGLSKFLLLFLLAWWTCAVLLLQKENAIPKKVHWVHKDRNSIRPDSRGFMEHCIQLNPEYEFMFHSDDDVEDLIEAEYPQYFQNFYSLNPSMKRVDMSRYFLLHFHGGVYQDLDYECVHPYREWLPSTKAVWLTSWPDPALMISAPNEPFWVDAIESVFEQNAAMTTWETTGPSGLNSFVIRYIERFGAGVVLEPIREPHFAWEKLKDEKGRGEPPQSKIGFISLWLFDPCSCSATCLRECEPNCGSKYTDRFMIHHCANSWRGTTLGQA